MTAIELFLYNAVTQLRARGSLAGLCAIGTVLPPLTLSDPRRQFYPLEGGGAATSRTIALASCWWSLPAWAAIYANVTIETQPELRETFDQ
ncbi:MAG: hypothetical protein ABIO92_03215 [Chloroflexia bacterium]